MISSERKLWGISECIQQSDESALYRLYIERSGYSSIHYHAHKWQIFCVEQGVVCLREFDDAGHHVKSMRLLGPGEACVTSPNVRHQFIAQDQSVGTELYLRSSIQPVVEEDIVRLDCELANGTGHAAYGRRIRSQVLPVEYYSRIFQNYSDVFDRVTAWLRKWPSRQDADGRPKT